jgi:hypothetical protein
VVSISKTAAGALGFGRTDGTKKMSSVQSKGPLAPELRALRTSSRIAGPNGIWVLKWSFVQVLLPLASDYAIILRIS